MIILSQCTKKVLGGILIFTSYCQNVGWPFSTLVFHLNCGPSQSEELLKVINVIFSLWADLFCVNMKNYMKVRIDIYPWLVAENGNRHKKIWGMRLLTCPPSRSCFSLFRTRPVFTSIRHTTFPPQVATIPVSLAE